MVGRLRKIRGEQYRVSAVTPAGDGRSHWTLTKVSDGTEWTCVAKALAPMVKLTPAASAAAAPVDSGDGAKYAAAAGVRFNKGDHAGALEAIDQGARVAPDYVITFSGRGITWEQLRGAIVAKMAAAGVPVPAPAPAATTAPAPAQVQPATVDDFDARVERLRPYFTSGSGKYVRAAQEGVAAAMRKHSVGAEWEIDMVEAEAAAGLRERDDVGRLRRGEPIAGQDDAAPPAVVVAPIVGYASWFGEVRCIGCADKAKAYGKRVHADQAPANSAPCVECGQPLVPGAAPEAPAAPAVTAADVIAAAGDRVKVIHIGEPKPKAPKPRKAEPVAPVAPVAPAAAFGPADVVARLTALTDLPQHVISAAVEAAMRAAADGVAPSHPVAPVGPVTPAGPVELVGGLAAEGGRRYYLPVGTRVKATAKLLRSALAASQRGSDAPVAFHVYAERKDDERPVAALRVEASVDAGEVWALVGATLARQIGATLATV